MSGRDPNLTVPPGQAARPPLRTLVFATTNAGKVRELEALLAPAGWRVVQDARGYPELQADTLAAVTEHGADALLATGLRPPFVLEDSGVFVAALNGFPGVYSRHALDTVGVAGLLRLLGAEADRRAEFRTDLLLVEASGRRHFPGACSGSIAAAPAGAGGFGFDPIFLPDIDAASPLARWRGSTFAQMPMPAKGELSHRGQAVRSLASHLAASVQTAKP